MSISTGFESSSNSSIILNTFTELDSDLSFGKYTKTPQKNHSIFSCTKNCSRNFRFLNWCHRKRFSQCAKSSAYMWLIQICNRVPHISTTKRKNRKFAQTKSSFSNQDVNKRDVITRPVKNQSNISHFLDENSPADDLGKDKSFENRTDVEKRRSQFYLSRNNQACLMTANDSFEQDIQLSNEANKVQQLETLIAEIGKNSTNNQTINKDDSCVIQYKRIKARRHSSSSQNEMYETSEKFTKSNLNHFSQSQQIHVGSEVYDPKNLPMGQEPVESQVRKWLENAKYQFNSYDINKSDPKALQEKGGRDEIKDGYTTHQHRSTDTAPPAPNEHFARSLRQTTSCLSSTSQQYLLPSLTLDSSDPYTNNPDANDDGNPDRRFSETTDVSYPKSFNEIKEMNSHNHGLFGLHSLECNDGQYHYDNSNSSPVHYQKRPPLSRDNYFSSHAESELYLSRMNQKRYLNNSFASQDASRRSSNDSQGLYKRYSGSNYEKLYQVNSNNRQALRTRTLSQGLIKATCQTKPTVVRSGSAIYHPSSKLDPRFYDFNKLNTRRYSSHLKPLDAQWGNKHSHSMEAMVPALTRQNRLCEPNPYSGSRWSFRLNSLSRGSMISEGFSTPGKQSYSKKANFIRQHRSFCSNSGGDTPQNKKYVNFISSNTSFNSGSPHVSLSRIFTSRASHGLIGQSSMPVSPGPKNLNSLSVKSPSGQRKVQSIEYDLQNYSRNRYSRPYHCHSANESRQNSLGASFSENVDSPVINRKVQQSVRTLTSSTSSMIINPSNNNNNNNLSLLNPPDLVFSPASRRVSAVDANQNQIDSLNSSFNLKNLLRQQTIYDDYKNDQAEADEASESFPSNDNYFEANQSPYSRNKINQKKLRSSSQNFEMPEIFPDKLPRHKSTGNYSFEQNRLPMVNGMPNYYYIQNNGNISPCDNNYSNAFMFDDSITNMIEENEQSLYEDENDWNWQLGPANTYQRQRGMMLCPSLGPVIDASDESTSDGKSGSQPTEVSKNRLNQSDNSTFSLMKNVSDQETKQRSFANLKLMRNGQLQKTTTDTSFDDSFEIPEYHQRSMSQLVSNTATCLKRPSSFTKIPTNSEKINFLNPLRQTLVHTNSFDSDALQSDKKF